MTHPESQARASGVRGMVGVVGAGAMGAGIAQVAALSGNLVRLLDAREGAAQAACVSIQSRIAKLLEKGKLTPEQAAEAGARLQVADSISDLSAAELVVEAIVENLDAKRALFSSLEAVLSPECIIASNTSSISVTALAAGMQRPERMVGMHFFNPVPLMKLVEVISGLATDAATANAVAATAEAWGKVAVHARSTPGFIVNRVARPYYAEALRVLQEGAASPATIDACFRQAGSFPMGPFELMDMIGHDVNFAVTQTVWKSFFHDPRFLPSLIQQELVDAGFLGRKTGRGFYHYGDAAHKPEPQQEPAQPVTGDIEIYGDSPLAAALRSRLSHAGKAYSVHAPHADFRVAELEGAVLYLTDGRTATQRASDLGVANLVLIDLALDYQVTPRLAAAAAAQCSAAARAQAIGLLQACGVHVSVVGDVPGLLLMRTVAMLANEAADAVNQGVCDRASADAAMQLGLNYPLGPFAWAQQLGWPTVLEVLQNLGQAYGEDRYRVSPLIRRMVCSEEVRADALVAIG